MPGPSGIEVARVIKTTSPRSRVIILTVFTNEEFLFEAIKAGAMGYLLKDCRRRSCCARCGWWRRARA